eukprot:Gb_24377 [translate_table: standard]
MDLKFQYLGFPVEAPVTNAIEGFSNDSQSGVDHADDTVLRLDPQAHDHQFFSMKRPGSVSNFPSSPKGMKRKWSAIGSSENSSRGSGSPMGLDDGSGLVLGLGCSASTSDSRGSSATSCTGTSAKDTDEESSMDLELGIQLKLGNMKNNSSKKPSVDAVQNSLGMDSDFLLQLSLSRGPAESGKSRVYSEIDCGLELGQRQNETESTTNMNNIPVVDEGSTSARWKSGGYMPSLLMAPRLQNPCPGTSSKPKSVPTTTSTQRDPGLMMSIQTASDLRTMSISGASEITEQQQRSNSSSKTCQFRGCGKGARGASGLCIAHGGGRRCQKNGCNKGAEGRTVYCKAHGGGRRCQHLGCTKSAEGRTDYCIGHGGGRRCSHEGCGRAARGKSGLCIRHGGGKRCQKEGCTKSAEGYSGLCISHGGGRRCQFSGCSKGAQGSTMYCKAHGGGKRCIVTGCNKGAEGSTPLCKGHGGGKRCLYEGGGICPKSVHGGTKFCVAHGGGKRCAVQGCTKSARGRTDFCVRHGGGKRCKFEGCGKSAQGSTDFCKAHGGGKRCLWGMQGSIYAKEVVQGKNGEILQGPCDRFARGRTGLCAAHSALIQDWRVHGGGTLGPGIGPGLFHGLTSASVPSGHNASSPSTPFSVNLAHYGRCARSELFVNKASESSNSFGTSSSVPCNMEQDLNNDVNDVDMVEFIEKKKDGFEDKPMAPSVNSDEMHLDTAGVGNNRYPAYWAAFTHPFMHTLVDANITLGGTAVGRPVIGHCIGQQVPVIGFQGDLGPGNSSQGSEPAVCQPLIPPQVLVPLSMKNKDLPPLQMERQSGASGSNEGESLTLPEGRVHGGGLMAMLSRDSGIGDALCRPTLGGEPNVGTPHQGVDQHRMFKRTPWI